MRSNQFMKKLASILMVAAIVLTGIANSTPMKASAAAVTKKPELSATSKYLHLGDKKAGTYNFNLNNKVSGSTYFWYVYEDKGNPNAVTISQKDGIVTAKEVGVAYIRCKITLPGGTVLRPEAKVTVRNNISGVAISNLPEDMTITASIGYDFNRTILNTAAGAEAKASGITRWEVADDTTDIKSVSEEGFVLPSKEGQFKIRAVSFQSVEKYNSWLSNKETNAQYVTAASEWHTITVIAAKGDAAAADFGVMNFSGVAGYTVGFDLIDTKASDVKNIVVKISDANGVLATATSNELLTQYPDATSLSAPMDVFGGFDYTADKSWTYSGWTGSKSAIPTEAEITVTFKNGVVKTVKNTNLTGDTSIFTKGDAEAADFGVMNFSGVVGYSVGLNLSDAKASDVESIVVKVSDANGVLATATSNELLMQYPDATSLSAPIDVFGGFDYTADKSWTYSGWTGSKSAIPTEAEIKVTFKNGIVKTLKNTNLTGDTSIFTKGNAEAADFGVMDFSGVIGYSVGVNLIDAKASDAESVVIKLYNGETVVATATSNELLTQYPDATSLSAPFDVFGGFDYAADKSWTYSGWNGAATELPTKAEITVTFKNGVVAQVTNANLTGDTTVITRTAEVPGYEVSGYNINVNLIDAKASEVDKIVVTLYSEDKELATVTSNEVLTKNPDAKVLVANFDINGGFDYEADKNWSYSGWKGTPSDKLTKAVTVITFKDGAEKTSTKQFN